MTSEIPACSCVDSWVIGSVFCLLALMLIWGITAMHRDDKAARIKEKARQKKLFEIFNLERQKNNRIKIPDEEEN